MSQEPIDSRAAFDGLDFRVEISPFTSCMRADGGVLLAGAPEADGVAVAAARSSQDTLIVNRERFAAKRLHDGVGRVLEIVQHGAVHLAGLHGFRTVAMAESLQPEYEDEERWAVQVVLFGRRGYHVVASELAPGDEDGLRLVDAVARSFERLDANGQPRIDEVPAPQGVEDDLRAAFDLALAHPSEDAESLGARFLQQRGQSVDEDSAAWVRACGAEAWFLRFNVEQLAGLIFDHDDLERIAGVLRQRLPGFDDLTYRKAMEYAEGLADLDDSDDDH